MDTWIHSKPEEATPKAAHLPLTPLFSDGLTILKGTDGKEHYF